MKYAFTFLILLQCACSTVPKTKPLGVHLISGHNSSKMTLDEIREGIVRGDINRSAGYLIEAYPYTQILIREEMTENGRKNMESDEAINQKIQSDVKTLFVDQTCFYVKLGSTLLETSKFEYWRVKLEDKSGKLKEAKFLNVAKNTGAASVPTYRPGDLSGYPWQNVSTVCFSPVNLAEGVKLHLIPQFGDETARSTLEWTADN